MILVFWMLSFKPIFSLSSFTFIWRLFSSSSLSAIRVVSSAHIAAAKSPRSCPTLCDPIDSSPPGSAVPGILQARTVEWVAISFSSAWKWKVKVKSLSCVRLFETSWTVAHQAPPSMGFSRQDYWSGVPLPPLSAHIKTFFNRRVRPKWEDFPGGASDKEPVCQCGRHQRLRLDPWVGKIPWRRAWQQPASVFLPGESHGQRNLQSMGSWSVRHDWSNLACTHIRCTSRLPWGSHQGEKKHDHAQKWSEGNPEFFTT